MKRWILGTWSLIVVVALAGCAAVGLGASPTGDAGRSPGRSLSENYSNALPAASQLIVGTLKLDGTNLAVTPQQAQQLLPLWEAYRALSASQTAAPQETAALVTQIQETMTAAQLTGIADMKLTTADFQSVFPGRGQQAQDQFGGTQTPGQAGAPQNGGTRRGNGGGGFAGGGGFEGGGGFIPGGGGGFVGGGAGGSSALAPAQTPNPQALATARAQRSGASGANPALVGFLIQYLQRMSGGTPTSASTAISTPAAASTSAATSTPAAASASAAASTPAATSVSAATITSLATSTPAATSASAATSTPTATSTPAAGGG